MINYKDRKIVMSKYYNGNTALLAMEDNGWEVYATLTVNPPEMQLKKGVVLLDVNNAGQEIIDILEAGDMIERIMEVKIGYVWYPIVRLKDGFLDEVEDISECI